MISVRKVHRVVEDTHAEHGRPAGPILRKVGIAIVVVNPLASQPFTEDVEILVSSSEALGTQISQLAMDLMRPYAVESYGKAALIGVAGEQEHGVAMLTTTFGDAMRAGVGGGKAWISSFTKRAAPGESIDVPLAHKDALYVRSHYDGMTIMVPDAPRADEIVVIGCFANRGRLNHRCGGLAVAEIQGEDGLR